MLQKLTAWMLALLIASPMCWCGWMHSGQAVAAASKPSCCHDKKAEDTQKPVVPKNQSDCPCSQTPKARELAASKVTVPAAPLPGDWLITWDFDHLSLARPSDGHFQLLREFHAQGPPLRTVPLFMRHCALLI